uniref:Uncharacterized protein n=1 Tax=Plectus sambesii TaxID=2011161 RepID=A0A914UYH5_9BILA
MRVRCMRSDMLPAAGARTNAPTVLRASSTGSAMPFAVRSTVCCSMSATATSCPTLPSAVCYSNLPTALQSAAAANDVSLISSDINRDAFI